MNDQCQLHSQHESRLKSIEDDIKELYKRSDLSSDRHTKTEAKLDYLILIVNDLKEKLQKYMEVPVQRWNNLITVIVSSTASAVIGFVIAQILSRK